MKITRKTVDSKWYVFQDSEVEFKVRPFPFSNLKNDNAMESLKEQFMYCLVDWKGLDDADKGTAKKKVKFAFNTANVEYLYDYSDEIRNFVFEKINEVDKDINVLLKN